MLYLLVFWGVIRVVLVFDLEVGFIGFMFFFFYLFCWFVFLFLFDLGMRV